MLRLRGPVALRIIAPYGDKGLTVEFTAMNTDAFLDLLEDKENRRYANHRRP